MVFMHNDKAILKIPLGHDMKGACLPTKVLFETLAMGGLLRREVL